MLVTPAFAPLLRLIRYPSFPSKQQPFGFGSLNAAREAVGPAEGDFKQDSKATRYRG